MTKLIIKRADLLEVLDAIVKRHNLKLEKAKAGHKNRSEEYLISESSFYEPNN
jgi:hypothetical protein